ncbi:lytic transglycosylase domain-containing protein [Ornithinimicrobium sp. LYQ103]|uniref:aggregation-promoting factor C-terminal-like domain-containing protein n=1 Tax=Ornithinimicrobium sp. LYQ103 TaxID=3378796 RepID=UPI003852390B
MTDVHTPAPVDGRHRPRRLGGPASAVTAGILACSLGLAAYAGTQGKTVEQAAPEASVGRTEAQLPTGVVSALGQESARSLAEVRAERASLSLSTDLAGDGVDVLRGASKTVGEERAAKAAAEAEAERQAAAERAAAEQAVADEAAAQAAAAQTAADEAAAQAAAEAESAAEQAATAVRSEEESASRSAAREPAPAQPAPAQPQPAPVEPQPVSSGDPRSIARSMLSSYGWGDDQFGCLDALWERESNWNPSAMNPSSGAYGIPQSLPASKMATAGADWQTNPATQISWGLGYISGRYGSPCSAWAHSESVGWY